VKILAPDLCGRFSGRVVRGLNARAADADWMKRRLERSGQRPISALVDISNYVMLELGRPSHIFDLAKVRGGLEVRWGQTGEQVELLNGQTITVDDWIGVIADAKGVEALAGVMGGEATRSRSIRATSSSRRRSGGRSRSRAARAASIFRLTGASIRTAASISPPPSTTSSTSHACCSISAHGERARRSIEDQILRLPERKPVTHAAEPLPQGDRRQHRGRGDRTHLRMSRPARQARRRCFFRHSASYRFDLAIEEDLIEEVARIWGFERIPAEPPRARAAMRARPETLASLHSIRAAMAHVGYYESSTSLSSMQRGKRISRPTRIRSGSSTRSRPNTQSCAVR